MDIYPIPSNPCYGVSEDGYVWRIAPSSDVRQPQKVPVKIAQTRTPKGYLIVRLHRRPFLVHRLLLEVFEGPCPLGCEARHLNGIRSDNSVVNLRWGTRKENHSDKKRHGTERIGTKSHFSKLSKGDVEWIRAFPKRRGAVAEMARRLQMSHSAIAAVMRGETYP